MGQQATALKVNVSFGGCFSRSMVGECSLYDSRWNRMGFVRGNGPHISVSRAGGLEVSMLRCHCSVLAASWIVSLPPPRKKIEYKHFPVASPIVASARC